MPGPVHLAWDLAVEPPTLGGALVLRQEGEWLAEQNQTRELSVHLGASTSVPRRLIESVFESSAFSFGFTQDPEPAETWPSFTERRQSPFSYFSFARLCRLYSQYGRPSRLHWSSHVESQAKSLRATYSGRLVCLHLRYVPPYTVEESNADGAVWNEALRKVAKKNRIEFLLLGDDELAPGILLGNGIERAADQKIDLATQLALVGHADGFLGMASGLCTAANLSSTPHVLFKHPEHHPEQMRRELGEKDRFPFATDKQRLWRKAATVETIGEALAMILS